MLKSTIAVGISKCIIIGVNFLIIPILLKYLNAKDYGIWITISSFSSWFLLFDLGIGLSLKNQVTKAISAKNYILLKKYISTSYLLIAKNIIKLLFLLMILVPFYKQINILLNLSNMDNYSELKSTFILIISVIILIGLKNISFILQGFQMAGLAEFISATSFIIIFIFIIYISEFNIIFAESKLFTISTVFALVPIFTYLIFSIILFSSYLSKFKPSLDFFEHTLTKDMLNAGLKFFIIQLSGIILYSTDNLIISHMFGNEYVTIYFIPFRYFSLITIGFGIVLTPIWSKASKHYFDKENDKLKKTTTTLMMLFFLFTFFSIIMLFYSNYIYSFWIGHSVKIPFELSLTLCLYVILLCWGSIFATIMNGVGKIQFQLYFTSVIMLLNIPLCLILGKMFGIIGIPIAGILCLITSGLLITWQYYIVFYNPYKYLENKRLAILFK